MKQLHDVILVEVSVITQIEVSYEEQDQKSMHNSGGLLLLIIFGSLDRVMDMEFTGPGFESSKVLKSCCRNMFHCII